MAADSWYYAKDGNQAGPIGTDELQGKLASGEVSQQDLVWREGMPNWQPAGTVAELASAGGGYGVAPPAYVPPPPGYAQPGGYVQPGGYPQPPGGYAPHPGGPGQPLGYGGYATGPVAEGAHQGKAVTAVVLSLVGFICFGLILGIVAISMAMSAMNAMKASGDQKGKGFAIAAVVIGIVDIVAWAVIMLARFGGR